MSWFDLNPFEFHHGQSENDALMDYWRQQQAGMGATLKHLYERIEALEKRVDALER